MARRAIPYLMVAAVAGAAFIPAKAFASEWWYATSIDHEHIFVDRESARRTYVRGQSVYAVWLQSLLRGPESSYATTKMLFLNNCTARTRALRAFIGYDANGDVKNSHNWSDYELDFVAIVPDTHAETLFNFACNSDKGAGSTIEFDVSGWTYHYVQDPEIFADLIELSMANPSLFEETEEQPASETPQAQSSGTAFFITSGGVALTSAHVVSGCQEVRSPRYGELRLIAIDEVSDLALVRSSDRNTAYGTLRATSPTLMEGVNAAGYPLVGVLGGGLRITSGTVSGLSGVGGNRTYFQLSAPIQPGNSGGPVLDQNNQIIGVVAGKLSDAYVAERTGGLPQNVNFAVSAPIVRSFLEENGVRNGVQASAPPSPADYTFYVECLR